MQLNLTEDEAIALRSYIAEAGRNAGGHGAYAAEADAVVKQIEAAMAPQLYTVIWTEKDGYEEPLIHTVEVGGDLTEEKVRRLVAIQWMHDTSDDPYTEECIAEVMKQVRLHFAYAGDIKTVEDWRS